MRLHLLLLLLLATPASAAVDKPAALIADGIPQVPDRIADATRPYLEFRTGSFQGWNPRSRSALITTRFGNVPQVHEVAAPMAMRRQISFEPEAIAGASYARRTGDVLVVQKDVGGTEFWQLYTLADGRLQLLTDGKSRNQMNAWSHDGRWLAYTSTRRNGADSDIYVVDPRNPISNRMVAAVKGGGWTVGDFSPDGRSAIVLNTISINKSDLYRLDLATGRLTPIGDHRRQIAYGNAKFAPDGTLWVTSDEDSDFLRLGTVDPASGRFTPAAPKEQWDVDEFDISPDGRFLAYLVNEAGVSRLRLLEPSSRRIRNVANLPEGIAGNVQIAPWGVVGLSLSSARAASDVYAIESATLTVTRWTQSETGGLDPARNAQPELVKVKSFDGTELSGFLYRPDPRKFPGKRPLIMNIHGGPEAQFRPGFRGRENYYVNELGVAQFWPNVRGSSGYGKHFVALDNGPFKREDSVRDIGAFLDFLAKDPGLDPDRTGVSGGSYGGYMCYASAIRYGDRLRAANCVVAISNFVTFLENTQDYRRDLRRVEYGDERDRAQRAKLLEISPLTRAGDLRIPLMVVTGGNDPRVPASEADQIVKAVRAKGGTAWHLLGQDEGHGFAKKANQDYQFWASLLFWQRYLIEPGVSPARDMD